MRKAVLPTLVLLGLFTAILIFITKSNEEAEKAIALDTKEQGQPDISIEQLEIYTNTSYGFQITLLDGWEVQEEKNKESNTDRLEFMVKEDYPSISYIEYTSPTFINNSLGLTITYGLPFEGGWDCAQGSIMYVDLMINDKVHNNAFCIYNNEVMNDYPFIFKDEDLPKWNAYLIYFSSSTETSAEEAIEELKKIMDTMELL